MKTINPYVHIFNTLEGATSRYANTHPDARLLVAATLTKRGDYFVDTTPKHEERLDVVWPERYRILSEKKDGRTLNLQNHAH